MKKMIVVLCFFLFLCSSILFSASICARNVVNDTFGTILIQELDLKEKIHRSIEDRFPQNDFLGNIAATILSSIIESEETSRVLNQYLEKFIEDVVQEKADGEAFVQMLRETLQKGIEDPSVSVDEQAASQLEAILDQIDLSSAYEQVLGEVHAQMSTQQLQLLRQYLFIRSDTAYYGSLCIIVLSAVLFFIQGIRKGLRNLALSSFLVSFMIGTLWALASFAASRFEADLFGSLIQTSIQPMMNICCTFFMIAVISFAVRLINQKIAVC